MQLRKNLAARLLPPLFCLFSMLLVACGGAASQAPTQASKAPASGQIYVYPQEGVADIATFDPALSTDVYSINAIDMVFTGLVQFNDKLQVVDQLAQSHQVSADGLTWTFHLRPNLKFSDGTPLTSQDVAYSIDRALDPAVKSTIAITYLGLIKDSDKRNSGSIKSLIGDSLLTPDPQTLTIVTKKKAVYFLDALTYSCSYVVERKLIDKYGNLKWTDHLEEGGGDGPWTVASYQHNKQIVFVPNPTYYGAHPLLRKVVFPFYSEIPTGYKDYQVGRVSTSMIPTPLLAQARALPDGQYHEVPALHTWYLGMNYLVKPFDNIKIRQAFALALDKNAIAENVFKGAVIPTNHIVPQGMPGYNPDLIGPDGVKGTGGDPTLAKQLFQQGLQEEGMTLSTLPPITLVIPSGNVDNSNAITAAQAMWQSALGVSIKINDIPFNTVVTEMTSTAGNKSLPFWMLDWIADYPDPQDWTTLQFDKGAPYNDTNYGQNSSTDAEQQQATQQLLEQADVNPDATQRLQQYNQAEQQLVNDVAWLPLYQITNASVRKPCVVGVVDNAQLLTPPDDWGKIYISTATPCANTSSYQ
jgi:oligopeptide transport system substrate-binding protein